MPASARWEGQACPTPAAQIAAAAIAAAEHGPSALVRGVCQLVSLGPSRGNLLAKASLALAFNGAFGQLLRMLGNPSNALCRMGLSARSNVILYNRYRHSFEHSLCK